MGTVWFDQMIFQSMFLFFLRAGVAFRQVIFGL